MSRGSDGPPKTPPKTPRKKIRKTSPVTPPTIRAKLLISVKATTSLIAQKDLMRTSSWSLQNLFLTLRTAMSTPSSRLMEGLAYKWVAFAFYSFFIWSSLTILNFPDSWEPESPPQHIGLSTLSLAPTVGLLAARGAMFRKPPPTYYHLQVGDSVGE